MQRLYGNPTMRTRFLVAASFVSLSTALLVVPTAAQAQECLLDTDGNDTATDGVDTDGGAQSNGDSSNLACGAGAAVTGLGSTAIAGVSVSGSAQAAQDRADDAYGLADTANRKA